VLQFKTGSTALVVYKSDFAGTNKANAVVWGVGDEIEAIAAALKSRGVAFEQYPGMDYKDGIHSAGAFKMVWFKDPDGNILHLNSM
jgi:extradiol dioxygenase family protein